MSLDSDAGFQMLGVFVAGTRVTEICRLFMISGSPSNIGTNTSAILQTKAIEVQSARKPELG
jgi:hypothetical protein